MHSKKRAWALVIMISSFVFFSVACLTPVAVTDSTVPLAGVRYEMLGPVESESCMDFFLGIPRHVDASLNTALEKARAKVQADALVEVVVDQWSLYLLLYNKYCTIVRAKGIRILPQSAPTAIEGARPEATAPVASAPVASEPAPEQTQAPTPPAPAAPPVEAVKEASSATLSIQPARPRTRAMIEAEKKAKAAEEKKRAEEEKRKAQEEKKKAEEEARRLAMEKQQAEEAAKRAAEEEARRKAEEEERRPVPEEFWGYCKFQSGELVRIEQKSEIVEGEFIECVHSGVRVRPKGKDVIKIPFEKIWSVARQAPPAPAPATPETPAAPPAKPAP